MFLLGISEINFLKYNKISFEMLQVITFFLLFLDNTRKMKKELDPRCFHVPNIKKNVEVGK